MEFRRQHGDSKVLFDPLPSEEFYRLSMRSDWASMALGGFSIECADGSYTLYADMVVTKEGDVSATKPKARLRHRFEG